MTEPPVRWLAIMGTFSPSKLGCAEAGIVTARWSFGGESVSVRSGRQEAINESMLGPPESSYVSIATACETSQRSCRARYITKARLETIVFTVGTTIEAH